MGLNPISTKAEGFAQDGPPPRHRSWQPPLVVPGTPTSRSDRAAEGPTRMAATSHTGRPPMMASRASTPWAQGALEQQVSKRTGWSRSGEGRPDEVSGSVKADCSGEVEAVRSKVTFTRGSGSGFSDPDSSSQRAPVVEGKWGADRQGAGGTILQLL